MSWLDNIKNDLIITTGDGKQYKPTWVNAKKEVSYNVAIFEFAEVPGSLVNKKERKGRKFPIEIFFQGDDHLITASDFESSANDKRPWTLQHPFYGKLLVQPAELNFDNTALNLTKITSILLETITETYPAGVTDPVDNIAYLTATTNATLVNSYANNPAITKMPDASAVAHSGKNLGASLQKFYSSAQKVMSQATAEAQDYFNALNKAQSAIVNLVSLPNQAISLVQAVITKPALFAADVKTRISLLQDNIATLQANLTGTVSVLDKLLFQANAGAIISNMAQAASLPNPGNYNNAVDVLAVIDSLIGNYNSYMLTLDVLQTANGGSPGSFIPDADALMQLNDLLNFAIANLYAIALNGAQQRSIILENDSNWILLAQRFYGLLPDDSTITNIINQNNAGLNEMFHVRKGRVVFYYI